MDKIIIEGGNVLSGEIIISGSKNISLPLIAASILCNKEVTLIDIPNIQDSLSMLHLVSSIGAKLTVEAPIDNGYGFPSRVVKINCSGVNKTIVDYEIVRKMRASIVVLGPLLARFGHAEISLPGGCTIGARPVDLHIEGLRAMGANIDIDFGYIKARVNGRLKGNIINFTKISVGATQNILMAAVLAEGQTIINNAALEPEVTVLGEFLQAMGAKIEGIGTSTITIEGVEDLHEAVFKVPADRLEAATYAVAAAITNGKIIMHNTNIDLFKGVDKVFSEVGIKLSQNIPDQVIAERATSGLKPCKVHTEPYPGFPTDMQAHLMTLMLKADGISEIYENIFENRFMHVPELIRMGAKIDIVRNKATIYGSAQLKGADVMASDLRASVSLIIAGLVANGTTTISRIYHLDRGYDFFNVKLKQLGAKITRVRV